MFSLFHKGKSKNPSTNEMIKRIKNGDGLLREAFISQNKAFILKTISHVLDLYITQDHDEFSIGLMAFNEAIDKFEISKNGDFFNFSHQVIKWRVFDYIRANRKNKIVYPFSYFNQEDGSTLEDKAFLKDQTFDPLNGDETSEEIFIFKQNLGEYSISLKELVYNAPKHKDSLKLCIGIARTLASDSELFDKLEKNKKLPVSDLLKKTDVHKKTLERNRKFIIAVSLIIKSNLQILKGYVENAEKGGGNCG